MNFKVDAYLEESCVIGGILEKEGPIGNYLDYCHDFNNKSFEDSEIEMLDYTITLLLKKINCSITDFDIAISGELSNQLATTSYTYRNYQIPLIGIYSACSSIAIGIGLASILLSRDEIKRILVTTSCNNQSAERQFRNPNEYGGEKEPTQTSTSTIGAAISIVKEKKPIHISSFTIGKVIDVGFKDSLDFGRAMVPGALETLFEHFEKNNKTPNDYDLILTGDLSKYGSEIVKKELEKVFGIVNNYNDCGLLIYDIDKQNVLAGGSGPGTSAAVLLSYVKKKMLEGKLKRVLLCATGVLMNPTMVFQKNSLPSIAHCIELEVIK